MAQLILALEMVGDEVRAGLAERAWSNFTLLGTFSARRAEDEPDLLPALLRLLEQTGTPDTVVAAFPGDLVAKRLLTLPFQDHRKLEQAVPFALEEHLPFGVEDAVVSYALLERREKQSLVLAALARKSDLRAFLELLARAGLDPKTVTLSSLALSQLVRRARNGDSAPAGHLLVNLDHAQTAVALIDESGLPHSLRVLPLSLEGVGEADGARGQALIAALRQTALAQGSESVPADLIVSGPLAASTPVRGYLTHELGLPVRGVEEIEPAVLKIDGPRSGALASCCAMLLGELPSDPLALINFRRGEFAFHGWTGDLAPLYTSAWLGAALLVLVILNFALGLAGSYRQLSAINADLVQAAQPVLQGVPADRITTTLAARIGEARKRLRLLGGSSNVGSPLDTLLSLSQALPRRVNLDIDEFSIDENSALKISGRADSYAAIDTIKRLLSNSSGLTAVQITDERPGPDHKIAFHLNAVVSAGGD